jgi:hypothetical protein
VGKIHTNKGRVGEERRGKETDGCSLTLPPLQKHGDNPNTTQTLEYAKDKYNAKIIKRKVSPKVPPTTYKG